MPPQQPRQPPAQSSSEALARQFGGRPVADLATQFGGRPVESPAQLEQTPAPEQAPSVSHPMTQAPQTIGRVAYGAVVEPVVEFAGLMKQILSEGPIDTAVQMGGGLVGAHQAERDKALEAYETGDYQAMLRHGTASLIPLLGPAVSSIVDEAQQSGDWATASGRLAGLVSPVPVPRGARMRAGTRGVQSTNPAERSAVAFAEREGIPIGAGTATGSPVIRGMEWLSKRTGGGELATRRFTPRQATALTETAERLADRVYPSRQTPVSAGADVRRAIEETRSRYGDEATQHYERLRELEGEAPRRNVSMTIQTRAADGSTRPTRVSVPMSMPVDLKSIKAKLRPLAEQWRRQMPVAQQRADPGLHAIDNILGSHDYMPASIIDTDLSALKAIQRRGGSGPSQGLLGQVVSDLDGAVQRAVAEGGAEAVQALREGRAATVAKYNTDALLKDLVGRSDEPRRAYDRAVWSDDKSIDLLRQVKEAAPAELPKLGRAFLDNLFEKATAEGGFTRSQGLWSDWQRMGRETKDLLYGSRLSKDLDDFFLLGKRIADNPNPSGSAYAGWLATQGTYFAFDPVMGTVYQIVPAVLSRLLTNQRAVRTLTNGLRVSIRGDRAAQVAAFGQLMREVGEHMEPTEAATPSVPAGASR